MTEADAVDRELLGDILAGRLGSFEFLYARDRVIAYSRVPRRLERNRVRRHPRAIESATTWPVRSTPIAELIAVIRQRALAAVKVTLAIELKRQLEVELLDHGRAQVVTIGPARSRRAGSRRVAGRLLRSSEARAGAQRQRAPARTPMVSSSGLDRAEEVLVSGAGDRDVPGSRGRGDRRSGRQRALGDVP